MRTQRIIGKYLKCGSLYQHVLRKIVFPSPSLTLPEQNRTPELKAYRYYVDEDLPTRPMASQPSQPMTSSMQPTDVYGGGKQATKLN